MTIEEFLKDIQESEFKILEILRALEEKYNNISDMPVQDILIKRWNGSNGSWGPITGIKIRVNIN